MLAIALSVAPLASANAQITGLFNTGVDGSGNKMAVGSTDTHYTVLENSGAQAIVTNNGAYVQDANSAYIWQQADGNPGGVVRNFRTTFTLLSGYDPTTAFISGQWSTDNAGLDIFLNGVSSGQTSGGFGSFTSFLITNGFVVGLNTLDFEAADFGAPAGVDIRGLTGSAEPIKGTTTPEPASIVLVASGLAGIGFARRLRRRQA